MSQNQISKQRLVLGFLQFLKDEVKAESANPEKQESLEGIYDRKSVIQKKIFFTDCFQWLFNVSKQSMVFHLIMQKIRQLTVQQSIC